ncbi:MAG: monovalent cation/H+ antiporter complex subunit F [Anaerolineae bacterium]
MAIWMIVGLWLVYLALTANLELSNLVLGLLIAAGLTLLLRPPRGTFELRRLPAALLALGRYLFIVAFNAIKSGLFAARLVLDPSLPVKPGIIAIPSGCDSELATALSAHSITLAPGEMVVRGTASAPRATARDLSVGGQEGVMITILTYVLYLALLVHIGLLAIVLWRVWRGENVVDRLMGADLLGTLTLSNLVLLALIEGDSIYIDVALGLAALGFIGTIALAKYVADEQMF